MHAMPGTHERRTLVALLANCWVLTHVSSLSTNVAPVIGSRCASSPIQASLSTTGSFMVGRFPHQAAPCGSERLSTLNPRSTRDRSFHTISTHPRRPRPAAEALSPLVR